MKKKKEVDWHNLGYFSGPIYKRLPLLNGITNEFKPFLNTMRQDHAREKLTTTIGRDYLSDLRRIANEHNQNLNEFIEYLLDYFVSTENCIYEAQQEWVEQYGQKRPLPPYLRMGVKYPEVFFL